MEDLMKSRVVGLAGAAALSLLAGPAMAAQPADMQERPAISEELGLGIEWDLSGGAGAFAAAVTDASTGEELADISGFVNSDDIIVSTDGTVTVRQR